jgi:DNA-directed RNA polymerase specialized sigma24 family protein
MPLTQNFVQAHAAQQQAGQAAAAVGRQGDQVAAQGLRLPEDAGRRPLPGRLSAAFALRELDGRSSEEIREILGFAVGNLWVLLHRARLGLARCLHVSWFGGTSGK